MPPEQSKDRRQFAAECLALARQSTEPNIRLAFLDLAQKWLELARRSNDEQLHPGQSTH